MPVTPGETYTFTAWERSSSALTDGRFGGRLGADGSDILDEVTFGATSDYTERQVQVTIPEGVDHVTVYIGFDAPGTDTWMQIDDVSVS